MSGYQAIDADGHVYETPEMWQKYLEPAYKSQAPKLIRDNWGKERYLVEGKVGPVDGWVIREYDDISKVGSTRLGGIDPAARLKDMDGEQIEIAVLYPTVFMGMTLYEDAQFAAALCRAYNNWLSDYCARDPKRLKGVALLPFQDTDESVKEIRRAKEELGFIAAIIPPSVRGKNLDDPTILPFFAEAERLSIAIAVHESTAVISEVPFGDRNRDCYPIINAAAFPVGYMYALGRLIYHGVYDRFPGLRTVFLEAGAGWAPYWMWRLDNFAKKLSFMLQPIKKQPSDYIRSDQIYFAIEPDEPGFLESIEVLGSERLLFSSDYPHHDAEYGGVDKIRGIKELSAEAQRNILRDNAARLYQLPA